MSEFRTVAGVLTGDDGVRCRCEDGSPIELPKILAAFLKAGDRIRSFGSNADLLIERGRQQLVHATIGFVGLPKAAKNGEAFVRAELPSSQEPLRALVLATAALRKYFYLLDLDPAESLYKLLGTAESASPSQLRFAWRMRAMELRMNPCERGLPPAERAFNILAHPDLRNCYDALRKDEDALPLFPYGGFGAILVAGHLTTDGTAFFAERILAYKPEMVTRKVFLPLRRCEFLSDSVICRDPRRKLEARFDASQLPAIHWDLTWNAWKHWLKTRIEVEATFVSAGKYRLSAGEWILRRWQTALPSRLNVTLPDTIAADIEQARAIHTLLGQHADLIAHIRRLCDTSPVGHRQVETWFNETGAASQLRPQHVTWQPDYEPYYFEQLRKRSAAWYLFRSEYLFVWRDVLISEIPQTGHATYVFARPDDLEDFFVCYAKSTREDIRHNRENVASALGYVGRVVRGKRKKRWLTAVLKQAGAKADYVESFD